MKRFVFSFGLATSLLGVSSAQSATSQPTFEVASVKLVPQGRGDPSATHRCFGGPGTSDPETLRCSCPAMADLIVLAYEIRYTGFDGPRWMWSYDTCYDIVAKVPPGATRNQFRLMLQNLLAERFHLSVHHETRTILCYALVVGKGGPRLKASAGNSASAGPSADGTPLAKNLVTDPPWTISLVGDHSLRLTAKGMELKAFAGVLELGLQAPVADETGLAGYYDYTLTFLRPDYSATAKESDLSGGGEDFPDMFSALQSQLGLKLNAKKLARDVLVADHADKVPTDN